MRQFTISRFTRSQIECVYDGMPLTIQGEAYAPGYGTPNFVICKDSIVGWDPPNDSIAFSAEDKSDVLQAITAELKKRNITFEVE